MDKAARQRAANAAWRRHRRSLAEPRDELGDAEAEHREIMDQATAGWDEGGWRSEG